MKTDYSDWYPDQEVRHKLLMDEIIFGRSISHTDADGKVTRIDPRSPEAFEILEKLKSSEEKPDA